jgi:transposase-like protein
MPLSPQLWHVDLTLECPHCGHPIIKKGGWFVWVHRFNCEGCNREVPITYSDKVVLFKKHAHLSRPKPRPT